MSVLENRIVTALECIQKELRTANQLAAIHLDLNASAVTNRVEDEDLVKFREDLRNIILLGDLVFKEEKIFREAKNGNSKQDN